jgi:DNA-binding SARP family transcriptional activator
MDDEVRKPGPPRPAVGTGPEPVPTRERGSPEDGLQAREGFTAEALARQLRHRRAEAAAGRGQAHWDEELALVEAALALHRGDLRSGRQILQAWLEHRLRSGHARHADELGAARLLLAPQSLPVAAGGEPHQGAADRGAAIRIKLLGGFELTVQGQPVRFRRRPPRRLLLLLKWLAAQREEGVPIPLLADALWPDSEGDHAVNALKVSVHRLRLLLRDHDAILIADGVASLDHAVCATDVRDFSHAVERAMRFRAVADGDAFEQAALQAFSQYAGPMLPGEEPFPWLIAARDRTARLLGALSVALGERFEATGRADRACWLYESVLQHEPLEQLVCRALMNLHLRQGQHREAVAAYERCRRALLSAVGLPPSQDLQALHRSALGRSREDAL